jgi:hypothetical protein
MCEWMFLQPQVRVFNDSKREAALILAGLNPSGAFSFVNAPRTVAPGGSIAFLTKDSEIMCCLLTITPQHVCRLPRYSGAV